MNETRPALANQLAMFVLVGGISAVVDFGLLLVGLNFGHLEHNAAKAISWCAGTATAYALNRRWTFKAAPSKARFAAVMLTYATTFVVQVGLFAVLYPALSGYGLSSGWAATVGFVIAQGVATIVNFIIQRWAIFK